MKMPRDSEDCPICKKYTNFFFMVYDNNIKKWICEKCGKQKGRNITTLSRYCDADKWFGKGNWYVKKDDLSGNIYKKD